MDAGRKRETLMKHIEFQDKNGSFIIHDPENYSGLYLPLAGEKGLKSSITPNPVSYTHLTLPTKRIV